MDLADKAQTDSLNQAIRQAKQLGLRDIRQAKQLDLKSSWRACNVDWELDNVKRAKDAALAQVQDLERAMQQFKEKAEEARQKAAKEVEEANSTMQQLKEKTAEVCKRAAQEVEEAKQNKQLAEAESALLKEQAGEGKDQAMQQLATAQTKVLLRQEELDQERKQMACLAEEACKLGSTTSNMEEQMLRTSKHIMIAVACYTGNILLGSLLAFPRKDLLLVVWPYCSVSYLKFATQVITLLHLTAANAAIKES